MKRNVNINTLQEEEMKQVFPFERSQNHKTHYYKERWSQEIPTNIKKEVNVFKFMKEVLKCVNFNLCNMLLLILFCVYLIAIIYVYISTYVTTVHVYYLNLS